MSGSLFQIVELSKQMDTLDDVRQMCQYASDSIVRGLSLPDNVIYLQTPQQRLQQVAAAGHKHCPVQGIVSPITLQTGEGVVGTVAQQSRSLRIEDTSQAEQYVVDDAHRFSELAVPIVFQGEVLGVIDSEHPEKNFFNDYHQLFLESVSAMLAPRIAHTIARNKLRTSVNFFQQQLDQCFSSSTFNSAPLSLIEINESPLSELVFKENLEQLLKHYSDITLWSDNLLLECKLVTRQGALSTMQRIELLKQHIESVLMCMSNNKATELWSRLISRRYVTANVPQQLLADELNMGYSTFRRHQKLAIQHLLEELWLKEDAIGCSSTKH